MRVEQIEGTFDGYLKHSKLSTVIIDTIPKLIFSKVYSYSDNASEKFLAALEILYKDSLIKPLLDVIAVQIVKQDDVAIVYGATLPVGAYGSTAFTMKSESTIAKLSPEDQAFAAKIINVVKLLNEAKVQQDPLESLKKVEIQAHLAKDLLLQTISHEFAHLVAGIVFDNYSLGYNGPNHKAIYEKCRDAFALKVAQLINPNLDAGIYPGFCGRQILSLEFNRLSGFDGKRDNKDAGDHLKIDAFINSILYDTGTYQDSRSKDAEIFARIFESFVSTKEFPLAYKLLGEFSEYFYKVLNTSIDAFMASNQALADALRIKPNELGSYGIRFSAQKLDISEELYFAVVSGDALKAKELVLAGADPGYIIADFIKIINVVLLRGNYELGKFMLEHCKNIDFESKDLTGQTTFEFAKAKAPEAYDLVKGYEPIFSTEDGVLISTESLAILPAE